MPSKEDKAKRILVICPHPVGFVPGQRLKYEQYFSDWKKNGYHVDVKPFMSVPFQKIVYKIHFFCLLLLYIISSKNNSLFQNL